MRVKLLFQILLLLTALIISIFTINHYFYENNNLNKSKNPELINNNSVKDKINTSLQNSNKEKNSSNILQNVIYENFDNDGNKYIITAKYRCQY